MDLRRKAQFYGIQREWAELEIISIIDTPRSDQIAKTLIEELKINSPKDTVQLDKAKETAYTDGQVLPFLTSATEIPHGPLAKQSRI